MGGRGQCSTWVGVVSAARGWVWLAFSERVLCLHVDVKLHCWVIGVVYWNAMMWAFFTSKNRFGSVCVILINAHLKMSDVKRLPERLDCMLFRVRFEEERKELQDVSCWGERGGRGREGREGFW